MTCNPSALAVQAQAFAGLTQIQLEGIKTYLLAKRAGLQNTNLLPLVGTFASLSPVVLQQMEVYLLGGTSSAAITAAATPYYGVPASLITAAEILILCTLTGTTSDPAALLALASVYMTPGYPRQAAQVYALNSGGISFQTLLNAVQFQNSMGTVCLTCEGRSILPFAEAGLLCASGSTLYNDLFEVWNLDDSLVGNFAGYTFNNAAPLFQTGKIGDAVGNDASVNRWGSAPGTSIFRIDQSFTLAGWVFPGPTQVLSILNALGPGLIDYVFLGTNSVMGPGLVSTFSLGFGGEFRKFENVGITANAWHCVFGGYDATINKAFFRSDAGAVVESAVFTQPPSSIIGDFQILAGTAGGAFASTGRADVPAMWRRRLTVAEMDAFYNGGAGIQFPW